MAVEATLWTTFTKSKVNLHATQFKVELLFYLMVNSSTVVPTAGEKGFFLRYVRIYAVALFSDSPHLLGLGFS